MKHALKLLVVSIFSVLTFMQCTIERNEKYMVVGYVAGYRDFDFSTIKAEKLTHINYAFANIIDGEVKFDTTTIDNTALKADDIQALHNLKKRNPALKILVSVGGWVWSGNFSDAALTEKSRIKFARSAADFVRKYNLDGIDFDWEYPNQAGAGNVHRVEDIKNFTLLLKTVREELDAMAKAEGEGIHYLQTIATGADEAYINNTELGEAHRYLDFINIMTYDFYNGWHKTTGHHSNYKPSARPGLDKNNVLHAVDLHVKAGVPLKKLNLGIPFYGRKWEGVKSTENNGLFQEAATVGMIEFYRVIEDKYLDKNGFKRYWDATAMAPYLWNPDSALFISYEDEESIKLKIEYLKQKGLGGVMFWEYSDDVDGKLLDAVDRNLNE